MLQTTLSVLVLVFVYIPVLSFAWVHVLPLNNGGAITARRSMYSFLEMTATNNNQNKDAAMLDFMSRPPDDTRNELKNKEPLDDDTRTLVETIVKAADGRKAADIVALNVQSVTSLCSALVILSGNSRPQNQAIVKAILDAIPQNKILPEGTADSGWMLLDYGGVMVHVMTPKSRLYYNVEGQWFEKGGTRVNLDGVLMEAPLPEDGNTQQLDIPQEQDPFWS